MAMSRPDFLERNFSPMRSRHDFPPPPPHFSQALRHFAPRVCRDARCFQASSASSNYLWSEKPEGFHGHYRWSSTNWYCRVPSHRAEAIHEVGTRDAEKVRMANVHNRTQIKPSSPDQIWHLAFLETGKISKQERSHKTSKRANHFKDS